MLVNEITDFEKLLKRAIDMADKDRDIDFTEKINNLFINFGYETYISSKEYERLKKIAGKY